MENRTEIQPSPKFIQIEDNTYINAHLIKWIRVDKLKCYEICNNPTGCFGGTEKVCPNSKYYLSLIRYLELQRANSPL